MEFSVGQITKAFRVYQNQYRIGELNRQSNLKTVQGQVDRVDLSASAQQLLEQAEADPFFQVPQLLEAGPSRPKSAAPPAKAGPVGPVLESEEFQLMDFTEIADAGRDQETRVPEPF